MEFWLWSNVSIGLWSTAQRLVQHYYSYICGFYAYIWCWGTENRFSVIRMKLECKKKETAVFAKDTETERRQDLHLFVALTSVQQPLLWNTSLDPVMQKLTAAGKDTACSSLQTLMAPSLERTHLYCQHSTDAGSHVTARCSQVDILVRRKKKTKLKAFFLHPPRQGAIRIRCSAGVYNVHNLLTVSRAQMASSERQRCTIVENVIWLTGVLTDNNNNETKNGTQAPVHWKGTEPVSFEKTL